jgi:hypothetical protein
LAVEKRDGAYFATMAAMPAELKQEFKLVWVGGNPRLVGIINGVECHMEKMYIKTKKRTLNPIPKILFIRVWGTEVATGSKQMQETVP